MRISCPASQAQSTLGGQVLRRNSARAWTSYFLKFKMSGHALNNPKHTGVRHARVCLAVVGRRGHQATYFRLAWPNTTKGSFTIDRPDQIPRKEVLETFAQRKCGFSQRK